MAEDRPLCICVAGPNGSGKSTLAQKLAQTFQISSNWIDPDRVARQTMERQGLDSLSYDAASAAFTDSRNERVRFAEAGNDFGFETVFSHESNGAFLRALKAIGYEVHLYFVCTDNADINVLRVRERVAKGGHYVQEHKIRNRYLRSLKLLSLAIRSVDRVSLFDNSAHGINAAGQIAPGRLICDIRNNEGASRVERIRLLPPLPTWVLTYGLFPYADKWPTSTLYREALRSFPQGIDYNRTVPPADIAQFLTQFRNPTYNPS